MSHRNEVPLVIIPDKEDPGCADIFVDGTVNGRLCRFILDTGATQTHLVNDAIAAASDSIGTQISRGILGDSLEQVIQLSEVAVGPMTSTNFNAVKFSRGHPAPRNLLGMDVLGTYPCHFDFSKEVLTIEKRARSSSSIPLKSDASGHPLVDVIFGLVATGAVWDTGAGITVIDTQFIARNLQYFDTSTPSWGTDATGTRVETPTFIMSHANIAGISFAPHRVAAVDLSGASGDANAPLTMILGYTTLRQANWYFNFPEHWWEITGVQ